MKLLKIITISFTFLLLVNNCGYTPIFVSNAASFKIESSNVAGDADIGNKFLKKITNIKLDSLNIKKIHTDLTINKIKTITMKNTKGEAQTYKIEIEINIKSRFVDKNIFFSKEFLSTSMTYDHNVLESVNLISEKKIIDDMINMLSQKFIVRLNLILNKK